MISSGHIVAIVFCYRLDRVVVGHFTTTMALSSGAIAGIAVGSVLGVAIIIGTCVFCLLWRKKRIEHELSQPSHVISSPLPIAFQPGSYELSQPSPFLSRPSPIHPRQSRPSPSSPRPPLASCKQSQPEELGNYGSMQVKGIRNIGHIEPVFKMYDH
ncbi:hypothetical protein BKA63DRAFT_210246 [Paraphoma chrysanthemicola]|nr:hypothetical protein BKA63DRAFT_210246 [Paraphoma chrysanthemicola]